MYVHRSLQNKFLQPIIPQRVVPTHNVYLRCRDSLCRIHSSLEASIGLRPNWEWGERREIRLTRLNLKSLCNEGSFILLNNQKRDLMQNFWRVLILCRINSDYDWSTQSRHWRVLTNHKPEFSSASWSRSSWEFSCLLIQNPGDVRLAVTNQRLSLLEAAEILYSLVGSICQCPAS